MWHKLDEVTNIPIWLTEITGLIFIIEIKYHDWVVHRNSNAGQEDFENFFSDFFSPKYVSSRDVFHFIVSISRFWCIESSSTFWRSLVKVSISSSNIVISWCFYLRMILRSLVKVSISSCNIVISWCFYLRMIQTSYRVLCSLYRF